MGGGGGGGGKSEKVFCGEYPISGVEGEVGGNLPEEEKHIPVEESMKSLVLK